MNIIDVEDAIYDLEQAPYTYDNAAELASLYIIQAHMSKEGITGTTAVIQEEVEDILPAYRQYCQVKRQYQCHEVTEQAVVEALRIVGEEIRDLFNLIYSGTDMGKERKILHNIVETLKEDLDKKSKNC